MYDHSCEGCPLHLLNKKVCAPAKGPNTDSPRVLFVTGDVRPEGEPWALLQEACKAYGIGDDWAYTSAVKCKIPDSQRNPYQKQVNACAPFLDAEIEAFKPDVVVPLGNVALKRLTGKTGITKFSGRTYESEETDALPYFIFPIIDPAAVLHDEKQLPALEAAFAALQAALSGDSRSLEYPKLSRDEAVAAMYQLRDSGKPYSIDLETTGINPRFNTIRTFSIATGEGEAWWAEWDDSLREPLVDLFLGGGTMIAHNAVFELRWFMYHVLMHTHPETWRTLRWRVDDTKLLYHLLEEEGDGRLTALAKRFTPIGGYDDAMEAAKAHNDEAYATVDLVTLGNYNAGDSDATFRLRQKFRLKLMQKDKRYPGEPLTKLYEEITEPAIWTVAQCELFGRKFDLRKAGELHATLLAEEREAMDEMLAHPTVQEFQTERQRAWQRFRMARMKLSKVLRKTPIAERQPIRDKIDLLEADAPKRLEAWGEYPADTFNPNSTPQVRELLFDRLGVPVLGHTDTGLPATAEKFMLPVIDAHPFVGVYLKWKKANTLRQRYLEKRLLPYVEQDGFVYGSYMIDGTATGRWSSTSPNLQNVAPRLKTLFTSRFAGGSVVECDFSQLELRLMAWACDCEPLLEAFKSGADIHKLTAHRITGIPLDQIDKDTRKKMGKCPNFGLAYGAYPKRFSMEFGFKLPEAERIWKAYHKAYPEIRPFIDRLQATVQRNGWLKGFLGRVRTLPDHDSPDTKTRFHALLAGSNFPIQNLGAEFTTWAFCRAAAEVAALGLRSVPLGATHDSLTFDCPPEEVEQVATICCKWMGPKLHERYPWMTVPMVGDAEAGPSWGEMESIPVTLGTA